MSPLIIDYCDGSHVWRRHEKNMSFELSSATLDDVRRLVDIEFHAFEDERTNQVLSYRDCKKPSHFERAVGIYTAALAPHDHVREAKTRGIRRSVTKIELPDLGHSITFLKVTDIETDEIVSFAKAEVMSYSLQELLGPADAGHDGEPVMNRDWFALNERLRREYMGLSKHCYIGMVATRPCFQHNGAGTMLLDAMLAQADDTGLEVYLEATQTARPLYEKHGFETVNELYFDPSDYGLRGFAIERQTVMVRGALGDDGRRRPVRDWDTAVAQTREELERA